MGPHPSLPTLGPGGGDLTEALKLSPLPDGGSWGKRLKWNPPGSQSHLTNPYPAKKAGGTGTKGASGLRASLQQRSLMAILTLVRYLTAPGSEHLRQMRKSPAVVNGRQGQQQEASSFCPLVRSCSGQQMAVALNPSQCQVLGATQLQLPLGPGVRPLRGPRSCYRPTTSLPGRCPRLERCALCFLHMFTPAQEEVCGRNCFTQSHPFLVTFLVQGF